MNPMQIRNRPHDFAGVHVHHFDARAVRDIKPPGGAIHGAIIPTARAADLDLVENLVAGRGERRGGQDNHRQNLLHSVTPC
jgi:hypothetical protein